MDKILKNKLYKLFIENLSSKFYHICMSTLSVASFLPTQFPTPPAPKIYKKIAPIDYSNKIKVAQAAALFSLLVFMFGVIGAFGTYESPGFIATTALCSTFIVLSVGANIFYVKAERKAIIASLCLTHDPKDEILAFVRAELAKRSDLKPYEFPSRTVNFIQPQNAEIKMVAALYSEVKGVVYRKMQTSNKLEDKEVDRFFKIGYALACLALEDLPACTVIVNKVAHDKDKKHTYHDVIYGNVRNSYRCYLGNLDTGTPIAYFACDYQFYRAGWYYLEKEGEMRPRHGRLRDSNHTALFYQPNTPQFQWRLLYNDLLDKLYSWVPELEASVYFGFKRDVDIDTFKIEGY